MYLQIIYILYLFKYVQYHPANELQIFILLEWRFKYHNNAQWVAKLKNKNYLVVF